MKQRVKYGLGMWGLLIGLLSSCGVRQGIPNIESINSYDTATQLMMYAEPWVGKPHGYRSPELAYPLDCSGLVVYLYRKMGVDLPRSSQDMYREAIPTSQPEVGDLLFFWGSNLKSKRVGHVGILMEVTPEGDWVMLHVSSSKGVVLDYPLRSDYFSRRYVGAGRVLPRR